jgi:hypothetical protein
MRNSVCSWLLISMTCSDCLSSDQCLPRQWHHPECVQVCNDPMSSKLHVPGSDMALEDQCVPASVQLGGKMAALTTILRRLAPEGVAAVARPHLCPLLDNCGNLCPRQAALRPVNDNHTEALIQ